MCYNQRMTQPLSFRWPDELVAQIDAVRGLVPRSAWVRECVEMRLVPPNVAMPGGVPNAQLVAAQARAAAPEPKFDKRATGWARQQVLNEAKERASRGRK